MTNRLTISPARLAQACLASALLICSSAPAVVTTVTIKVTVVAPPPCTINYNAILEVPFGDDVLTNKVDGKNYMRRIPFSILCKGQISNAMKLRFTANSPGFGNGNIVKTINPDLGIALYLQDGTTPLMLTQWINFSYPTLPVINAAPTKRPGSTLKPGYFSASATIQMDYQ